MADFRVGARKYEDDLKNFAEPESTKVFNELWGHRSLLQGATTGQIWNNLSFKRIITILDYDSETT